MEALVKETALKKGFTSELKPEQLQCLQLVVDKKDFMAILPTGYGKSLIYQLAPHVLETVDDRPKGKTVGLIITPLNSIMLDQIHAMHSLGISACAVDYTCTEARTFSAVDDDQGDSSDDSLPADTATDVLTTVPISDILSGKYHLVYAHPEALVSSQQGNKLLKQLEKNEMVACIAIDEAHIILEWGTSFRKDFSRLGENLLPRFPTAPVMVFTATASQKAQAEISRNLHLRNPHIISINPDRSNIKYFKIERPPSANTQDHLEEILEPIALEIMEKKQHYPLTIMYTDTSVISFAYSYLDKRLGIAQYIGEAIPENRLFAQYHQTYTEKMKSYIVKELCKEESKIRFVLATVALGMGLNAPHVRSVIHYKPPTCIEKYFQETGRAGRDGEPSTAILYYNNTDIRPNRPGIEKSMIQYCKNDTKCMREVMLEYFEYKPTDNIINCCDVCDRKKQT